MDILINSDTSSPSYNDAVFDMYKPIEKPQSYVGTMKANWDERNQHYYY